MHPRSSYVLWSCSLLTVGCGFFGLNGDDVVAVVACEDGDPVDALALSLGSPASSYLSDDGDNGLSSSCGGSSSAEKYYRFAPSESGRYRFRVDADFDAVLYVVADGCEDPRVLDCVDGTGTGSSEELDIELQWGESYLVVVDGYTSSSYGSFTLSASQTSGSGETDSDTSTDTSPTDCSTVPNPVEADWDGVRWSQVVAGTTLGGEDQFSSACGVLGSSDEAWIFEAPEEGVYHIEVVTPSFLGSVSVRDPTCTEIACDDQDMLGDASSEVQLTTVPHTIVVSSSDGGSGDYQLLITQVLDEELSPTCREPCSGPADCTLGEVCLDTTVGNVCLPSECESCFVQGLSCSSYPYTCTPLGCS